MLLQEFDHPHILLQNEKGYFYKIVQQTGFASATSLKSIAESVRNVCQLILQSRTNCKDNN